MISDNQIETQDKWQANLIKDAYHLYHQDNVGKIFLWFYNLMSLREKLKNFSQASMNLIETITWVIRNLLLYILNYN